MFYKTFLLGALLLSCVACAPETQTRQGAPGELCFADADCRSPLICEESVCVDSAGTSTTDDVSGDNNSASDSNNDVNGGSNNSVDNNGDFTSDSNNGPDIGEPSIEVLCAEICGVLEDCGLQSSSETIQCNNECSQVASTSQVNCLLRLDCRELRRDADGCIEPPRDRRLLCEEVYYSQVNCPGGLDADHFLEVCLERGSSDFTEDFYDIEQCVELRGCQDTAACAADWSGLPNP